MASTDLIFDRGPLAGSPADLVFGDEFVLVDGALAAALPGPGFSARVAPPHDAVLAATLPRVQFAGRVAAPNDALLAATLPGPSFAAAADVFSGLVYPTELAAALPGPGFAARVAPPHDTALAAVLPGLAFAASGTFDSNVSRPTVGHAGTSWQTADATQAGAEHRVQPPQPRQVGVAPPWQPAQRAHSGAALRHQDGQGLRGAGVPRHQDGQGLQASTTGPFGQYLRRRFAAAPRHQDGQGLRTSAATGFQDRYRDRRPAVQARHQEAMRLRRGAGTGHSSGLPARLGWGARHQEAMRPPAGRYVPPTPPGPAPCYTPSGHLVFADAPGGPALLFICENHGSPGRQPIVVPVREVYMVTNNVRLIRVAGGVELPVRSLQLQLDADSWTWGFSASLEGDALALLGDPTGGVDLEAWVNGVPYRVRAESINRTRRFGSTAVQLSGRGRSSELAAPYAPVQTFANTASLTAQQLAASVLTVNGVPMSWTLDWQIADWLVPAGAWSAQGSYMDALLGIVGAAGGYLQPHATDTVLHALPRFPVPSWQWAGYTPDFVLPPDVVSVEGMSWVDKPGYNRVFLSGNRDGLLGQITRAGTAGDVIAPMVTDPLFTATEVLQARGTSILSDTGRVARVTLRLPVLPETGLIEPGKFVGYDGSVGLVRSLALEAGEFEAWQTLGVDSYV